VDTTLGWILGLSAGGLAVGGLAYAASGGGTSTAKSTTAKASSPTTTTTTTTAPPTITIPKATGQVYKPPPAAPPTPPVVTIPQGTNKVAPPAAPPATPPTPPVAPPVLPPTLGPNAVTLVLTPGGGVQYAPTLHGIGSRLTLQAPSGPSVASASIQDAVIDGVDAGIVPGGTQTTLTATRSSGTAVVTWSLTTYDPGAGTTSTQNNTSVINYGPVPTNVTTSTTLSVLELTNGSITLGNLGVPGSRVTLIPEAGGPQFISPLNVDGYSQNFVSSEEATITAPGTNAFATTVYWSGVITVNAVAGATQSPLGQGGGNAQEGGTPGTTVTYTIYYGP